MITKTVISVGCRRLFGGRTDGVGSAVKLAIVVAVEVDSATLALSASVPVLTLQRSTPHWADALPQAAARIANSTA